MSSAGASLSQQQPRGHREVTDETEPVDGHSAPGEYEAHCVADELFHSQIQFSVVLVQFSSVQDGIYALGKAYMCSTLSQKFP